MQIVIDVNEEVYSDIMYRAKNTPRDMNNYDWLIANGTPLPKGHAFIAICDSDFPITEEVKQKLKNTVFVGDEDCNYCFDMTEIIEADKESEEQ